MDHNRRMAQHDQAAQEFRDYGFQYRPLNQPMPQNNGIHGNYYRGASNQPGNSSYVNQAQYGGRYQSGREHPIEPYTGAVTWESICSAFKTRAYPEEPSIFEEMEINPSHICTKGLAVLKLGIRVNKNMMDDTDLAGPIFFCLLLGIFLFMSGKGNFGYIYTFTTLGWAILHSLFNLMNPTPIGMSLVASVLGYCLLPILLTSLVSFVLRLRNQIWGFVLSLFSSLWCTYSASSILSTVLQTHNQKALMAYPLFLFYSIFALLSVF